MTTRKRLVRKTPLLERMSNAPFDAMLRLNETISLLEIDVRWWSNCTGLALTVAYVAVKGMRGDVFADDEFIDYVPKSVVEQKTTWLGATAIWIEAAIILFSMANTLFLFKNSRQFTLFHCPTEPAFEGDTSYIPKSKNTKLASIDLSPTDEALVDSDSDSEPVSAGESRHTPSRGTSRKSVGNSMKTPVSKSVGGLRETLGQWSPWPSTPFSGAKKRKVAGETVPRKTKVEMRWVLNVWDPPQWSAALFCWSSPPSMFALFCMNRNNWYYQLPMALGINFLVFFLMQIFADREMDQTVLNNQLQGEYNRFVYSLPPFRTTRSIGVNTVKRDSSV
ncbi:hypothetical protein BJ741DRAFT_621523 [Chytriomyces cf. hyalinus JEL632]|nr:hypothetical protein BJ741DRAFT_621523 [Chytriomyces cf. hyalinus JEL632]